MMARMAVDSGFTAASIQQRDHRRRLRSASPVDGHGVRLCIALSGLYRDEYTTRRYNCLDLDQEARLIELIRRPIGSRHRMCDPPSRFITSCSSRNVEFCSRSRRVKNFTGGALKEVPLGCIGLIFRGLNFSHNADIGQNNRFRRGTTYSGGLNAGTIHHPTR